MIGARQALALAAGGLLAGCGTADYRQCDPRQLDTIGYYRCGEAGIARYTALENDYLTELQDNERRLSNQLTAQESEKQQLRARLKALQARTRQAVLKIQQLQQAAASYQQLSEVEQAQLVTEMDQALAEYEAVSENVADALLLAKGAYDVADTYRQVKHTRQAAHTVRVASGLSKARKLLKFTRLTLPSFLIGLAIDYAIDRTIESHLNEY